MPESVFARDVVTVARELLGATLTVDGVGGRIVETEAYAPDDPASHSFAGPTRRNAAMYGSPGTVYVYRSYGLHWCLNVVCGRPGSAVLIRALQPLQGLDTMRERRGTKDLRALCAGPGRLTEALGITGRLDGAAIDLPPFVLRIGSAPEPVVCGPRIGITKAAEVAWRFGIAGSPFLSRPFRRAPSVGVGAGAS